MMVRFLKSTQPGLIFLILFLGIVLWLPGMILPGTVDPFVPVPGILVEWLGKYSWMTGWSGQLIMFVLNAGLGFFAVHLNTRFNFIHERSFLPALFVILLAGAFPESREFNPAVLAAFLLIFSLELIFATYRYPRVSFHFFRASFLIGLASLIYPPAVIYFLVVYVGLIHLRTVSWREWLTPILGLLTPIYLVGGVYYAVTGDLEGFIRDLLGSWLTEASWPGFNLAHYVFLGFLALLTMVSSFHMIARFTTKKVSSRIYLQIIFWTFLISLAGYFVVPSASADMMIFAGIPLSYLFTTYFLFHKPEWWCEIMWWGFLLSLVFLQVLPYLTK